MALRKSTEDYPTYQAKRVRLGMPLMRIERQLLSVELDVEQNKMAKDVLLNVINKEQAEAPEADDVVEQEKTVVHWTRAERDKFSVVKLLPPW